MSIYNLKIIGFFLMSLLLLACSKEETLTLKNDVIKRTLAPAIVGQPIQFVYAMGASAGKVKKATVRASIAGEAGTGFDPKTYYYDVAKKIDVGIVVAACNTATDLSTAIIRDTTSVTLRYYYVVPELARGKSVSLTFTAESTTGEVTSYSPPSFEVQMMDMRSNLVLESGNRCYFSIADMAAYTESEVSTRNLSAKIDFVYNYKAKDLSGKFDYKHYFVSAASEAIYLNGAVIPSGWTKNNTAMRPGYFDRDSQLINRSNFDGVFVTDVDMRAFSLVNCANYSGTLITESNVIMKSADGKYMFYILINKVDDANKKVTVSFKRLAL